MLSCIHITWGSGTSFDTLFPTQRTVYVNITQKPIKRKCNYLNITFQTSISNFINAGFGLESKYELIRPDYLANIYKNSIKEGVHVPSASGFLKLKCQKNEQKVIVT